MVRSHRQDLKAIARRAMLERGMRPDFPAEVLDETDRLAGPVPDAPVRDLRDLPWVSIDNDDSRDLDQLSVAEPVGGAVKVRVAIADVDAVVRRDSAIDGHARHNTTSVYTPAQVFPMLPPKLSYDLTSLGEDEERLAVVVEMVVAEDGALQSSDIYRSRVLNHAKLTYDRVAAWLEGHGPLPARSGSVRGLDGQLRLHDTVAEALRLVRREHGALQLETSEPRAVFEDEGVADLRSEEKNRAKDLIENLMVAANGVTARYLEGRGLPSLRRVLRSPARWERIVQVAAGLGARLPPGPDAAALDAFLTSRRAADPDGFPDLSLTIVKLMGRGEYAVEVPGHSGPGHFGLAAADYTHSTAPNRRFPDLITQRLLKAALAGSALPYTLAELEALARHCTERENDANKVERRVRKSAAALLLQSRIGQRFEGIVTGAADKGTWVRVFHPPVEGRVVQGFQGLDVGDRVQVELVATDVERGFIDFARRR